jgi:dihydrofolate reductase
MIVGIVAVCKNNGIGYNNRMPWPFLNHDMHHFKRLTTDNCIIMGANTWCSLGKKLPNRVNIVISKNMWPGSDHVYLTPHDAVDSCKLLYPDKDIYIIGGQQLFESCYDIIEKFFVTEINENYKCDRFLDRKLILNKFKNICVVSDHNDGSVSYTIKEYK